VAMAAAAQAASTHPNVFMCVSVSGAHLTRLLRTRARPA
jgi:hypothetical protein